MTTNKQIFALAFLGVGTLAEAKVSLWVNNHDVDVTVGALPDQKGVVDLSAAPASPAEMGTEKTRGAIVTPAFQYPIKPSDLDHNTTTSGNGMFTINNSGRYYISQDLTPKFASGGNGVAAVKITANNVSLDFNSKAIRVHPQSNTSVTSTTGVLLADSVFSVMVFNGDIIGHNGSSIVLNKGIDLGSSPKDLVLNDLHISQCKVEGISSTTGVNGMRMEGCSVTNCSAAAESAGFKLTSANDVHVKGCWFNNNDTSSGATHGIYLTTCTNCSLTDCDASNNSTSDNANSYGIRIAGTTTNCNFKNVTAVKNNTTGGASGDVLGISLASGTKNCSFDGVDISGNSSSSGDATGVSATSSESCRFKEVKLSNNDAASGTAVGVLLTGCTDFSLQGIDASNMSGTSAFGFRLLSSCKGCNFISCGAANNVSTAGAARGFHVSASPGNRFRSCYANNMSATGGSAEGFIFLSGSDANRLVDCEALDNSSASGNVHGFRFESNNGSQLVNCHANENSSSSGDAAGFSLSDSDGNTVRDCEANHNQSSSGGSAYGFQLVSACASNQFHNCNASINTTSVADEVAVGFYSNAGNGNLFQNCTAIGQVASGTGTSAAQYGAGFAFDGAETASSIVGCRADRNSGGSSGSGVGFGVYLRSGSDLTSSSTSAPSNTTIKDCVLSFNTGPTNKYGVFDQHSDSTSVMINNVSVGHGRCVSTLDTSFNFTDPATGMNFMFFHTGADENPANMIHETDIFNWTTISTKTDWHNVSVVTGQFAS